MNRPENDVVAQVLRDLSPSGNIKSELLEVIRRFPELTHWQHYLLVMLQFHRQVLMRLLNIPRQRLSAATLQHLERITFDAEQSFMALVNATTKAILTHHLSSVQAAHLQSEFLTIPQFDLDSCHLE